MSDEPRDGQGRLVCQKCGQNVARIWTSHRRTEADHRITYEDGLASFTRLPQDGGVVAYCHDEYLCYSCCYSELEPGEHDEPADLQSGPIPVTDAIEERAETEPDAQLDEEASAPEEPLLFADDEETEENHWALRAGRESVAQFAWGR
jgi:hypothetical protein